MPRSQTFLILLVCLSLGFGIIFPLFDRRMTAEATILGDTVAQSNAGNYGPIGLRATKWTAGSNGNITSLSFYCKKGTGTSINLSLAVYAWVSDSNAGALLGNTGQQKITSINGAWYTLATTTSIPIVSGTNYFLAFFYGNGTGASPTMTLYYGSGQKAVGLTSGLTFPIFPNPMTGESGDGSIRWSMYATYTESGTPSTPSSSVDAITPYWTLLSGNPKTITATATDPAGDVNVKNVSLWYRYGTTNSSWGGYKNFGLDTASPWSWSFTFTNGSGYYQFYSIAKDVDGNTESAPGSADRYCGYDAVLPTSSVDALTYTQTTTPLTVTVTAADTGYSGLKNVSLWSRNSTDNTT